VPFKGFNKCGRCRKAGRGGIYPDSKLKLEIVEVDRSGGKRLKVTCPFGHTWLSESKSASRYIRNKESELPKEV